MLYNIEYVLVFSSAIIMYSIYKYYKIMHSNDIITKDAFITDKNQSTIKILKSDVTNIKILNYIEKCLNNIYLNNDDVHIDITSEIRQEFESCLKNKNGYIFVEYKYNNGIYSIYINGHLTKLEKSNTKNKKIISAHLHDDSDDNNSDKEPYNITEIIRKFHGPDLNFHENIDGVVTDIENIVEFINIDSNINNNYKKLVLCDLYGDEFIINLKKIV